MDKLEIVFDNPGEYVPGQQVTGKVVLKTSAEIKARFLTICIHGQAFTHWSEHKYSETVYFSSFVDYVKGESLAWSASEEKKTFPIGDHIFPFLFQLPFGIPSSFEGAHGHIRYSVRVELDRPWKFNNRRREYFQVFNSVDLNTLPCGNAMIAKRAEKDIGTVLKKGVVATTVTIPKQSYAPGENLPISIHIDNASTRPAYCVRAELHQHTHYHASKNSVFKSNTHEHHKNETKTVAESRKTIKVEAKSKGIEELSIKIPKVIPNFQCPIIMLEYCLSVKVDTETSLNNTLHCEFPIIIGTIPIDYSMQLAPNATLVVPTAPVDEKNGPMPPPFSVLPSNAPMQESTSPSAPPPTYEESLSTVKM